MTDTFSAENTVTHPPELPLQSTDHPLFHEAEALINEANWRAAERPLAELAALYPNDSFIRELAASVHTRSILLESVEGPTDTPAPTSFLARSLKFVVSGVILIAIVGLAVVTWLAIQRWVLPQATVRRQETQVSQLRRDAQAALASGDYDRVVLAYTELLKILPDDPDAMAGLEQAGQLRATVSLYSEAIAEMEAHHWESALALLEQIQAEQPNYRDVAQRIAFIQEQQVLTARFRQAEDAFDRGDYDFAIGEYEALQSLDSGFQREVVQEHLFLSYLQLGLAEQEAAGDDPLRLQAALADFEMALLLRPDDAQAKAESQLLRLYLAGQDEVEAENWPQVIADLTPVYEARPDFAGGAVARSLYTAYVAWGDELFADGQTEQALVKYEGARLIRGVDAPAVEQKIAQAEETLATPTPTLTPTPEPAETAPAAAPATGNAAPAPVPTATPRPLPYALMGMSVRSNCSGFGYVHGIVWNAYNLPMAGVTIQAFNTTTGFGPLISLPTNEDGIYQIILENDQIAGLWAVQVLENGQPASEAWGQHLGGGCTNGAQELKVDWVRALDLN